MPARVVPTLMDLCGDESAGIRMATSEALAGIGEPAISSLLSALKHNDPYVRESAAHALQEIGSPRPDVVDALLEAAADPFPMVATYASLALFNLKDQAIIDELLKRQKLASGQKPTHAPATPESVILSEEEVRRSLPPTSEFKFAAELRTFERFVMTGGGELVVSIHKGKDRPEVLRIWLRDADQLRLAKEMDLEDGIGWFEEPRRFRHSGEIFLHIRKRYDGSGGLYEDFIWTLSSARLVEVPIEWPLPLPLGPGDEYAHGNIDFEDDLAGFDFGVWVKGDGGCCPSGGRIVGRLKFVKEAPDKWIVKLDSCRRLPPGTN